MPNWCSNRITIRGDLTDLLSIKGEEVFDTEAFLPMPKELEGIHSGHVTIDGVRHLHWRNSPDGKTAVAIPEEEQEAIREKCGTLFSNDWNSVHLGTKWGLCRTSEWMAGEDLCVEADTAWGPPVEFFRALAKMYPDLHITMAYAEGGMQYAGVVSWQGGSEIDEPFDGDNMYMADCMNEDVIHTPEFEDFMTEHFGRLDNGRQPV